MTDLMLYLLLGSSGLLSVVAIGILALARASVDWPGVKGRITHASLVEYKHPVRGFEPCVWYEYGAGGRNYRSRRIAWFATIFRDAEQARHWLGDYQRGQIVTVHYWPVWPALSVLRPGCVQIGTWLALAGLGAAIAISSAWFRWA